MSRVRESWNDCSDAPSRSSLAGTDDNTKLEECIIGVDVKTVSCLKNKYIFVSYGCSNAYVDALVCEFLDCAWCEFDAESLCYQGGELWVGVTGEELDGVDAWHRRLCGVMEAWNGGRRWVSE